MKRSAIGIGMVLALAGQAWAEWHGSLNGTAAQMTWQETLRGEEGRLRVEDEGLLYGVAADARYVSREGWMLEARGVLATGGLDSEGSVLRDDVSTTLGDDVDYEFTQLELNVGFEHPADDSVTITFYGGPGIKMWTRDTSGGSGLAGYDSDWESLYGQVGLRVDTLVTPGLYSLLRVAVVMPYQNEADYESSSASASLEPLQKPGFVGEAALRWRHLHAGIFAEYHRYGEPGEGGDELQPDVTLRWYGLRVGYYF